MQKPHHPYDYRPDIGGLRAVAILVVVFFHVFPSLARGGFVGVDIFFVISGHLISRKIFKGMERGNFSFISFYVHRIRRIFPALILVLLASFAIGWFTLLPKEYAQQGKHIVASVSFVQNIILWHEAGYFDVASELKPLLHLWSLAIEEQFYLFYPLLLWLAWRVQLNTLIFILVLAALSFALNVNEHATEVYFGLHTRFWELLAGGLLARMSLARHELPGYVRNRTFFPLAYIYPPWAAYRDSILNNVFATLGLLLIVAAVLGLSSADAFPGWWALFPIVGAWRLILAGPDAWFNRRILASRLMVSIGLIS